MKKRIIPIFVPHRGCPHDCIFCNQKKINKKIVEVPFDLESTGTKKLLTLFPLFYSVAEGDVVFIDEIDTGIHDVLFAHIIKNIVDTSKGQLIFTTHNTLLQN